MKRLLLLLNIIVAAGSSCVQAQVQLVRNGVSAYRIVIPANAGEYERKAAGVLQQYLQQMSSAKLPIVTDNEPARAEEISIGATNRLTGTSIKEAFAIITDRQRLLLTGDGKNTLYAVYHFLDRYLGCRKWAPGPASVPQKKDIVLPAILDRQQTQFSFRQVYYPAQYEAEFSDWHKLQSLEDEFGLWGHSYDKLLPARTYFKAHPEYYALVNGQRMPTQLCLSNAAVLDLVARNLASRIADDPGKKLWSVSQNDGFGYCACSKCSAFDTQHGGPQASVINFANKVAARFPGYTISTMAYLYSRRPPVNLKPAANVSIMLSAIDLNRGQPIETDPRSAGFRKDLKGWTAMGKQVMIWDYTVQFTNYLAPFPNLHTLQANLNYFARSGISGAFLQGTENTPGEFSELKTYLLSRLSWDPAADVNKERQEFMQAWYGQAGSALTAYQQELETQLSSSKKFLDIYGDPVAEWNSWLKPEQIVRYDELLSEAEKAVVGNPIFAQRVAKERLSLEFTVLQQARFYGLDKHGLFIAAGTSWQIKPGMEARVQRFVDQASKYGIRQLNEEGLTLDQYAAEWKTIFKEGPILHQALGAGVKIVIPNHPDYPGKGLRTLADGTPGYQNFQYNYLGWWGTDMEVIIDLGQLRSVSSVSAGFLEDQRHWAFLPRAIEVSVSADGNNYTLAGNHTGTLPEELYHKQTERISLKLAPGTKARYIRLQAYNLDQLPEWRNLPNRKPWLFCDEVAVH